MQAETTIARPRTKLGIESKGLSSPLPIYLALREFWRNRGRFILVSLVIAMITILVLFIDGLALGLGMGNIEYLSKLNAELIVFQENSDLSTSASRLGQSIGKDIRRVDGVQDVGVIGISNTSIVSETNQDRQNVSLIGVEPGTPGEPPVIEGRGLKAKGSKEAIIDRNTALRTGLKVGDDFTVRSIQGTDEKLYTLQVAGISDGRQYFLRPSIFVPYVAWDQIKPKAAVEDNSNAEIIMNVAAVKLKNPADSVAMAQRLQNAVSKTQVVDRVTAYKATPGYAEQQSTLNTIRIFTLLIGVLVLGGFFQIQTLQKVGQIGMLKAIGATNLTIAIAFLVQIVLLTILGVAIGAVGTLLLSLGLPPTVPITFTAQSVAVALGSLLIIGPLGGLVSLFVLLRIEPLTALGLAS
jgi:putative ABC transport system permease protein